MFAIVRIKHLIFSGLWRIQFVMSEQKPTLKDQKSGQEVAKLKRQVALGGKLAKTDARYWAARLFKNSYTKEGDVQQTRTFCARIALSGRRETFNLGTPNKDAGARRAVEIYTSLLANGWEDTLAKYKPKSIKPVHMATLGEFLREIEATAGFRASTYTVYSQSLRQLVAEIAEIGDQPALGDNGQPLRDRKGRIVYLSRKHRESGGRDAWVAKVDQQKLDLLTPEAIQRWKLAYIARAGHAPDAVRRSTNTAGAILRCARALFSDRALRYVKDKLMLPDPLPLAGLKIPKANGTRYVSKIDARELIAAAQTGLAGEEFKIFALAALCGLRKREIDTLLWRQVDFTSGQLRIEPTEYFSPKSEDSIGTVDLDDELLGLLRGWRAQSKGEFVVAPQQKPQRVQARSNYRCALHFRELYTWLRRHGVTARKPLHELRKELGAILASEQGIFAAQSVLRHAQISTTAAYYADKKRRITAGLGSLLAETVAPVLQGEFTQPSTPPKSKKKLRSA